MAFEFRFETVLNQRDWAQKKAEKELAEVQTLIAREKTRLENLLSALAASRNELRNNQQTRIEEVKLYSTFHDDLKNEIVRQEERINQLMRLDAEKRQALLKASGEKKAMETLKEKDLLCFNKQLQKKEEKFIDEISMIAQNHKMAGR
ncbi:MAG: flagellar export protein FliJ [Nitrospirota bacterium]|nr:flagellar export protein FliJ [Nitrospirota bacterium]